jgi:type II secretory pathway component PulF
MIEILTGLGYGIIGLAVMIGIGIVILTTLGTNVATQSATANTTLNTISGYLGTGSGGLATWIPIIIVLVIGMAFLGVFMARKGRKA